MVPAAGTGAKMGGAAMTWQPELTFAPVETHKRPTQAGRILAYLRAGNRITALEALERFQCFRLAARIHELRQDNWQITERTVETATGKRIAEYSL
jgi:hypothetical protein